MIIYYLNFIENSDIFFRSILKVFFCGGAKMKYQISWINNVLKS